MIAFKLADYVTLILAIGLQCSCLLNAVVGNIWAGTSWVWYPDAGHEYDGQSVLPLREYQGFVDFIGKFSHNPILGIGVGIVMTVLIQSSSATIGILIAMASQG